MTIFHVDRFSKQLKMIAEGLGPPQYWVDILRGDSFPENLWHSLLYVGCARIGGLDECIYAVLNHPDSRVRAYACFALGQVGDRKCLYRLSYQIEDPSPRVRIHARFAYQTISGARFPDEKSPRASMSEDFRLLISEDSGRAQAQLNDGLQGLPAEMAFASTYRETIEKSLTWKPHVIVTDNQKWGDNSSGLRMLSEISRNPHFNDIVTFMLTADEIEAAVLWHGGDYYLPKSQHALAALGYHIHSYLQGPINEIIIKQAPPDPSQLN